MPEVAIIGAGIAGLCFALALNQRSIKCTIYDLRESSFWTIGGLMLAPNALRILDRLGLFEDVESNGFSFELMEFRNDQDDLIDQWYIGNQEEFGYKCVRIIRPVFLEVLRKAVQDQGIIVHYGKRFSRVIEENSSGVVFELTDGSKVETSVLIGADGIHSSVRGYIHPDVKTIYSGHCAIMAAVDHKFRSTPNSGDIAQTTLFNGPSGSMLVLPQASEGSQTNLGKQWPYPEQDRHGWDAMLADKRRLHELFLAKAEEWPECVQQLLQHLKPEDLYIWPFYSLPDLPTWASSQNKRVIIIADAAHAIPPSAGQGACQAIEDAWTLAQVLAPFMIDPNGADNGMYADSITKWQESRQNRVDKARALTMKLNNLRLPRAEREKMPKDQLWTSEDDDLVWLYGTGRK